MVMRVLVPAKQTILVMMKKDLENVLFLPEMANSRARNVALKMMTIVKTKAIPANARSKEWTAIATSAVFPKMPTIALVAAM